MKTILNVWNVFLKDVKKKTCDLRNDEVDDEWITVGNECSEIVLLHDDMLLPHWKELANAMQLYRKGIFKISIDNLQLSASVIDLLMPVLKHAAFETINLYITIASLLFVMV